MNRGLYAASVGMVTQMNKMDVVSNNLANANTTGYKKDGVITSSFNEEMYSRINDDTDIAATNNDVGSLNLGNNVDFIRTDFTTGSLQRTDGPLDLAISGDGFFSVNYVNADGSISEKYTRDGSFTLGPNGELMTSDANQVLDENNAPIFLSGDSVPAISDNGSIYQNGELVAKLKITSFEDANELVKYGNNLYDITDNATPIPFEGMVEQGFIETSNVNPVEEMVEMISLSRAYEASAKVIKAFDTIMSKEANDIGKK